MTTKSILSMRVKLLTGFGLIILFLVSISFIAYWSINNILASQKSLYEHEIIDALDIKDIRTQQSKLRGNELLMSILSDRTEQESLRNSIDMQKKKNDETMQGLIERNKNRAARLSKLQQFNNIRSELQKTRERQVMPLILDEKYDQARQIILGVQAVRDKELQALADELVDIMQQNANEALADSEQYAQYTRHTLEFGSMAAIILSIIMTIWMLMTLRKISRQINEGVNVLASSASEITASSTQLAAGSAETAASVNQTTSTIEEVKQTGEVSAQKAKHVADVAKQTVEISQKGQKSMDDSLDAMNRIKDKMESIAENIVTLSEQSQDIGEIINTVNDLAEQSNLLAVNAAIEAAKAGKQGKGFSVVAHEVKNMAAQSKQATAQVKTILGDIQKALNSAVLSAEEGSKVVETGVKLSKEAGDAIRLLTENISESTLAATQIMRSAEQQLIGMDQVAQAMQNINQASVQNVASTKQVESAAHDIYQMGQKLQLLTEEYKV